MSGLHFHKLDLHVHTPASKCYIDKSHTPDQIVQAALDKQLSGIAITDHNSPEWIDKIKEAAKDTGLVIFPGVELSLHEGYHLIAIFDTSRDQRNVEVFLGKIGITPDNYGKQDTICKKSVYDVIDMIHEDGGLAVLAHIDEPKGIFFEQTNSVGDGKISIPDNCRSIINGAKYDAIECVHNNYPNGFDKQHNIKRFAALYQSSDNPDQEKPTHHSMTGIGLRYSWFNIEQIDIEGLRLCFDDPQVRIRLMDQYQECKHPKIISMHIGNNGFFPNLKIDFHESLNSIIGGQGVGKSLIVEFLRFGLCQPSDNPVLIEDHNKKILKRLDIGNTVEIIYQLSDGTQYKIERKVLGTRSDGSVHTTEKCTDISTDEEYEGDIISTFPILAYSQTEVNKISENKKAQLQLIDRLINTKPYDQRINIINAELSNNDKHYYEAIKAKYRLDSINIEIGTLAARIKSIDKILANPVFEKMKQGENKKVLLEEKVDYLKQLINTISEWQESLYKQKYSTLSEEINDKNIKSIQKITELSYNLINDNLQITKKSIEENLSQIKNEINQWMPEFQKIYESYETFLQTTRQGQDDIEHERLNLVGQKTEYDKEAKSNRTLLEDMEEIISERNRLLNELANAHQEYYKIRKDKYNHLTTLSDKKINLQIEHAADFSIFEDKLVVLLRGEDTLSVPERKRIARSINPRNFVQIVIDRDVHQLAEVSKISEKSALRVIEKLQVTDDFIDVLALQHICYPADVPSIRYRKEEGIYDELSELSVGQKCSALLIIALIDGTMPVIIDQPEDALDIASVWEDVTKKLRNRKESRQFILTTHNSSVAVGSDSNQFFVLKASANTGKIEKDGSIDRQDVRQSIIEHLEGGKEAYALKLRKYNVKI